MPTITMEPKPRMAAPSLWGDRGFVPDREFDVAHLGDLARWLRQKFSIDATLSDELLMESLGRIARESERRARWRAAFDSDLGLWLALRGTDLNTALNTIVAGLPPPRC